MLRRLLPATLALVLAACSTPAALKPGTSLEEARRSLGQPTAEMKLADGGSRLQYSSQPMGMSVWNADFDAQGRLRTVQEMMSDEAFRQIRAGQDTQADVLRDFGRPTEVHHYRLSNETAFMYRYYTHGRFKAAMFVYFDPAGVVKRTETGLDPWSLGGDNRDR